MPLESQNSGIDESVADIFSDLFIRVWISMKVIVNDYVHNIALLVFLVI